MPGKKKAPEQKVAHWNQKAELIRQKALHAEICLHMKSNLTLLEPVASKLRSMGVKFRCDTPQENQGDGDEEEEKRTFLEPGMVLEQVPFVKLKKIILGMDKKHCNEAHLRSCKEGKARDISKESLLRLLELVTGVRRSYVFTENMSDEKECLELWKQLYEECGSRFREVRLPLDFAEEGAFAVQKAKGTFYLKSINHEEPIDLKAHVPAKELAAHTIRFEENWGENAVMVVGSRRIDCVRLFPEALRQATLAAIEDARAHDDETGAATSTSQIVAASSHASTPTPKRARLSCINDSPVPPALGDGSPTLALPPPPRMAALMPPPVSEELPPAPSTPRPASDVADAAEDVEDDALFGSFLGDIEKAVEADEGDQ